MNRIRQRLSRGPWRLGVWLGATLLGVLIGVVIVGAFTPIPWVATAAIKLERDGGVPYVGDAFIAFFWSESTRLNALMAANSDPRLVGVDVRKTGHSARNGQDGGEIVFELTATADSAAATTEALRAVHEAYIVGHPPDSQWNAAGEFALLYGPVRHPDGIVNKLEYAPYAAATGGLIGYIGGFIAFWWLRPGRQRAHCDS